MRRFSTAKFLWLLLQILSFVLSTKARDFYHFFVMDSHNEIISLEEYRGKVSLVVNVASQCGYTDNHYKAMQTLQHLFKDTQLFNVLAFPCNQFGQQEPASNAEIYKFAKENYGVTFPIFAKVDVIGPNALDAWQFLAVKSSKTPDWNFWKYLINHKGEVIGSWPPRHDPYHLYHTINKAVDNAKADAESAKSETKTKKVSKKGDGDGEL